MPGAWHRAWHSPRSGPVILVLAGLPLLALAVGMAAFPFLLLAELWRALAVPGHAPFARSSLWYPGAMALAWAGLAALLLRARRIARANRGLDMQVAVRQVGRPASARALAQRLAAALAEPGLERGAPIREDYGAGLWLSAGAERFWLAVSEAGEAEAVISLAYEAGPDLRLRLTHRADRALFARLADGLRQAVAADPALRET